MSSPEKMSVLRANQLRRLRKCPLCFNNAQQEKRIAAGHRPIVLSCTLVLQIINISLGEIRRNCLEGFLRPLREARIFISNTDEFRGPRGLCCLRFSGERLRSSFLIV